MFKDAGNWWNNSSIQQIEKDGSVYALHGWNGEVYEECWKCTGKHNMSATGSYTITPIFKQINEDDFVIIDYEIREN